MAAFNMTSLQASLPSTNFRRPRVATRIGSSQLGVRVPQFSGMCSHSLMVSRNEGEEEGLDRFGMDEMVILKMSK